ncbi:MAG: hypothetical protein QM751_08555 [Paludibacteraceae bacterium]
MIILDFKGPYDLATFKILDNVNVPGVYIWGFKELISTKPETVVPYYVGITAQDTIIKTINDRHLKKIDTPDSTYLRLSEVYMREFYKGSNSNFPIFPIDKPRQSKSSNLKWKGWKQSDFQQYLYYYNNEPFLKDKGCSPIIQLFTKYANKPKSEYPIQNIHIKEGNSNNDTLLNRIHNKNFWIWYAEVDLKSNDFLEFSKIAGKKDNKKTFEILESFVKYSLEGITIGKSEYDVGKLTNFINQIRILNNQKIFKSSMSNVFLGNY